jgi:probable phosphoglycerate mutase
VERHAGASVLVVSHKATIRLVIGELLGVELRGYRDRLDQSPCGLNILDVQPGGRARLVLFNDVSHYATVPGPTGRRLSPWWA